MILGDSLPAMTSLAERSAHNVNYWRFGAYAGIGARQANHRDAVVRVAKPRQPCIYLNRGSGAKATVLAFELPLAFMMNALRLADVVESELFTARTGLAFDALAATVNELVDWRLMRSDQLALTELGYRQLNGVLARSQRRPELVAKPARLTWRDKAAWMETETGTQDPVSSTWIVRFRGVGAAGVAAGRGCREVRGSS